MSPDIDCDNHIGCGIALWRFWFQKIYNAIRKNTIIKLWWCYSNIFVSVRIVLQMFLMYIVSFCRAVPIIFIVAFILLFLASVTFFLGANMLKVCYSIAEDPANDDIPSYELFSQVTYPIFVQIYNKIAVLNS